jgi:UDP-N-acetylmuramate dehydrogenase
MRVYKDFDIQTYNTFGIAAKAAVFVVLDHLTDIEEALTEFGQPTYILWWWSNVVITKNLDGTVRHPAFTDKTFQAVWDKIHITCGAWCVWDDIVKFSVQQCRWWIENLVAIPWHVWAAPVQNIGAYGVEIKDVFVSLEAYDLERKLMVTLNKTDCHFGYRHSIFNEQPGKYMICSVTLELSLVPNPHLEYTPLKKAAEEGGLDNQQKIAETVENIRRSKLPKPKELGNCGSFFKNPVVEKSIVDTLLVQHPDMPHYPQPDGTEKLSAARLIDQSGCKGMRVWNIWTYHLQPLVLVNYWWGNGQEVLVFSQEIINIVQEKFGVSLSREVNMR